MVIYILDDQEICYYDVNMSVSRNPKELPITFD